MHKISNDNSHPLATNLLLLEIVSTTKGQIVGNEFPFLGKIDTRTAFYPGHYNITKHRFEKVLDDKFCY